VRVSRIGTLVRVIFRGPSLDWCRHRESKADITNDEHSEVAGRSGYDRSLTANIKVFVRPIVITAYRLTVFWVPYVNIIWGEMYLVHWENMHISQGYQEYGQSTEEYSGCIATQKVNMLQRIDCIPSPLIFNELGIVSLTS